MTKVLIYENRKCDALILDISTPDKEAAAYLKLFTFLDQVWEVYECSPMKGPERAPERALYQKAQQGDAVAAKSILTKRKNEEYESWYISQMLDPLVDTLQ